MRKSLVTIFLIIILTNASCNNVIPSGKSSSAPAEQAQISFMHFWSEEQINDTCAVFEKANSDILIKTERIYPEQYLNILKTRIASNSTPDIFSGWAGSSMSWIYDMGAAKDLSGKEFIKRLDEKSRSDISFNDRIYMVPINKGFIAVGYNKKIFDRMGYAIPKSYKEFVAICESGKKAGYLPLALGSRDSSGYILASWAMAVSEIYSTDKQEDDRLYSGSATLSNDTRWQRIIQRFSDWKQNAYIPKDQLAVDRMTNCLDEFIGGKAMMFLLGSWDLKTIREMSKGKDKFDLGLFPFPAENPENTGLIFSTSEGVVMGNSSEYPGAADKFMEYLSSKEANLKLNTAIGSISAFNDVKVDVDNAIDDLSQYMNSDKTWGYINSGWPPSVGNTFSSELSYYIGGSKSMSEVLRKVDEEWAKIIK